MNDKILLQIIHAVLIRELGSNISLFSSAYPTKLIVDVFVAERLSKEYPKMNGSLCILIISLLILVSADYVSCQMIRLLILMKIGSFVILIPFILFSKTLQTDGSEKRFFLITCFDRLLKVFFDIPYSQLMQ
jgi:hypothetical protein